LHSYWHCVHDHGWIWCHQCGDRSASLQTAELGGSFWLDLTYGRPSCQLESSRNGVHLGGLGTGLPGSCRERLACSVLAMLYFTGTASLSYKVSLWKVSQRFLVEPVQLSQPAWLLPSVTLLGLLRPFQVWYYTGNC
jgi:hypothetical protein